MRDLKQLPAPGLWALLAGCLTVVVITVWAGPEPGIYTLIAMLVTVALARATLPEKEVPRARSRLFDVIFTLALAAGLFFLLRSVSGLGVFTLTMG